MGARRAAYTAPVKAASVAASRGPGCGMAGQGLTPFCRPHHHRGGPVGTGGQAREKAFHEDVRRRQQKGSQKAGWVACRDGLPASHAHM